MHIRIVTYNVQFGLKIGKVAENIQKLSAAGVNVFCLQEVKEFEMRPPLLDTILNKLGNEWESETFIKRGSHDLGLCTLWKPDILKLRESERLLLPRLRRFNFYERIVEKKVIKLVKNPVQRGALIETYHINGKLLRICNLHLDWQGRFVHKAKQLQSLASYLKSQPPVDYEVICGDFNTIGVAPFTKKQEIKLRAILGPDYLNAYPYAIPTQKNFLQRLDYMFVKGARIHRAVIVKLKGSDHYPLVVDLEV